MQTLYLAHHGILGQRWGIRRYQNPDGTLTELGKKQYRYNKVVRNAKKSGNAKTENLEKYGVGLFNVLTKYGEKYVTAMSNGHDFDWQERFAGKPVTDWKDKFKENDEWLKINTPDRSPTEAIVKKVNPGFGSSGTTQNCAKCSATLELLLHGYSACAGRQSYPSASDSDEFWWKGAKPVQYDGVDSCEKNLKAYGNGTSGTIDIRYQNGVGHKMHWTNSTNGKFTIEDGQNGRVFESIQDMCNTYGADVTKGFTTYRLDNCEPNWDNMGQDSVIRVAKSGGIRNAINPNSANVYNKIEDRYVDTW